MTSRRFEQLVLGPRNPEIQHLEDIGVGLYQHVLGSDVAVDDVTRMSRCESRPQLLDELHRAINRNPVLRSDQVRDQLALHMLDDDEMCVLSMAGLDQLYHVWV